MADSEKRLDARTQAQLKVDVRWGRVIRSLVTEDVAMRGVFIRSDESPPVRELVRLALTVPGDGERVIVHGLVAHIVKPGGFRMPGFGVEFFAIDPKARERWSSCLRLLRATTASPAESPGAPATTLRV